MGIHGSWLPGQQAPDFRGVTASERRGGSFAYYLPARLAGQDVGSLLEREVREEALELSGLLAATSAQVDEATRRGIYPLLLRSESIASSQIERIDASARDVSYAQLGASQHHLHNHQALSVARNVDATRAAIDHLATQREWGTEDIERIYRALGVLGVNPGLREVDVWIGGRDKVRADYVAPPASEVAGLVDDLLAYLNTSGEHPLLLAAIAHLQVETIHPFEDGNGRVGRALVHAVLERGGVVRSGLLPISTAIRAREREYVARLDAVRTDRSDEAVEALNDWVRFFVEVSASACEKVQDIQGRVRALDELLEQKATGLRVDSAARRILPVLREQPVVTAAFIADELGVSRVAAHRAVETLVAREVLTPGTGKYRRSEVYQADDVLAVIQGAV
ncbi:Fic family protein [Brachybacterium muris]|uniref:Fic family protein n=1 Tax=Brachybacterium muris TaxID=219301 RepID=UPI00223C4CCA|nr:Fic family protein [Brachybacterium muris]MCT1652919.1 Fic family protein [Brachybacterium muris]